MSRDEARHYRRCQQPADAPAAQPCLRLWIACQRSDPAQGQAHRQHRGVRSRRARQRPQGSQCHALTRAARSVATWWRERPLRHDAATPLHRSSCPRQKAGQADDHAGQLMRLFHEAVGDAWIRKTSRCMCCVAALQRICSNAAPISASRFRHSWVTPNSTLRPAIHMTTGMIGQHREPARPAVAVSARSRAGGSL